MQICENNITYPEHITHTRPPLMLDLTAPRWDVGRSCAVSMVTKLTNLTHSSGVSCLCADLGMQRKTPQRKWRNTVPSPHKEVSISAGKK